MNENDSTVEQFKLDSGTRSSRFVLGAVPRLATRAELGAVLAADDAVHDDHAEILAAKLAVGTESIVSSVGTVSHAIGTKAATAVSSVKAAFQSGVDRVGASGSAIQKMPALSATSNFVGQAVPEVKASWDEAGYVSVVVVAEETPVESVNKVVEPVTEPASVQ